MLILVALIHDASRCPTPRWPRSRCGGPGRVSPVDPGPVRRPGTDTQHGTRRRSGPGVPCRPAGVVTRCLLWHGEEPLGPHPRGEHRDRRCRRQLAIQRQSRLDLQWRLQVRTARRWLTPTKTADPSSSSASTAAPNTSDGAPNPLSRAAPSEPPAR